VLKALDLFERAARCFDAKAAYLGRSRAEVERSGTSIDGLKQVKKIVDDLW
jgi:hypothetical protein